MTQQIAPLVKPRAAFILALLGAIFIAVDGLYHFGVGNFVIGGVQIISGLLVLVFGVLLYLDPERHGIFGILVLVFSLFGLVGWSAVAVVGSVLALVGGVLGIVHKPNPATPVMVCVQSPQRMCPKCGRAVGLDIKFCPFCGNALG